MDPLMEKHPCESPYVYCSNNGVKYIDPDGRDKTDRIIRRAKRQYKRWNKQDPDAFKEISLWTGEDGNNYVKVSAGGKHQVWSAKKNPKRSKSESLFQNGGLTIDGNGDWSPRQKAKYKDDKSIDMSDPTMDEKLAILKSIFGGLKTADVNIKRVDPHNSPSKAKYPKAYINNSDHEVYPERNRRMIGPYPPGDTLFIEVEEGKFIYYPVPKH